VHHLTRSNHATRPWLRWRFMGVASVIVVAMGGVGCTAGRGPAWSPDMFATAVEQLRRPLPGDLAALYHLRVPTSGGLRLAIVTLKGAGRATVSEPFGSAVSITAWESDGKTVVYDLREGCRFAAADTAAVLLGVDVLPLPQAVLLLGGRLPTQPGDTVVDRGGGRLAVIGKGWSCVVRLAAEPWRVLRVEGGAAGTDSAWVIDLDDHTSSLPGSLRVKVGDGRWAELRLKRLAWSTTDSLPGLPDLPPCTGASP
jgi:hypothetical protein